MPAPDKEVQQKTVHTELTESLSFREPIQSDLARVHHRITELLESPDESINSVYLI